MKQDARKTKKELLTEITALRTKVKQLEHQDTGSQPITSQQGSEQNKHLAILTELPEIVYKVDPDGKFLFLNNAVRVLGYEPEELIGKHFRTIVHPDDVLYFGREYVLPKYKGKTTGDNNAPKLIDERRTGPRKTKNLEVRLISKNWKKGKRDIREFYGIVTAFGDISATGHYGPNGREKSKRFLGSLGIIKDVTERRHMQEALKKSEEQYRDLVEKAGIAILIDDQEGKFKYYNARFAELFGYEYEEMKKQNIANLVHPNDAQRVVGYHKNRLNGTPAPIQYEFRGIRKDGTTISLEVQVVALIDGDTCIGTRSYIWDITARKRIEEELRSQIQHDELTGIHNRRGFAILAQQQLKIAKRQDKGFLILFADIDNLKSINDTHGHKQGDAALKSVAGVLNSCFRASDIIARIGGDEFAVLAIESSEMSNELLVRRLHSELKKHVISNDYPFPLTLSVGTVYCDPKSPVPIEDLLAQADEIMYIEKRKKHH